MLDRKTATLDRKSAAIIRKAICDHLKTTDEPGIEAIYRMQPLFQTTNGSGYTVLGLQHGDVSILVSVQFNEKLGTIVRNIKTMTW